MSIPQPPAALKHATAYTVAREPARDVWRCATCHRILAKLTLTAGGCVEIKCGNCNTMNVLRTSQTP